MAAAAAAVKTILIIVLVLLGEYSPVTGSNQQGSIVDPT